MHSATFLILFSWGGLFVESRPFDEFQLESFHEAQQSSKTPRHAPAAANDYRISANARSHINELREKAGLPPLPEDPEPPPRGPQKGRGFIDSLLAVPIYGVAGIVNGAVGLSTAIVRGAVGTALSAASGTVANALDAVTTVAGSTLGSVAETVNSVAHDVGDSVGQIGGSVIESVGKVAGEVVGTVDAVG
ncbi:uncharacterized protein LOC118433553 [Folsomia candida]|uniref:uncharacterized protein LOC118433553 n=1 Tax=Folsomia candida TaxID=158441 RepID=UPI001604C4B2|nr:uncharacterized protein LOC118433553 [Folsomia candida]